MSGRPGGGSSPLIRISRHRSNIGLVSAAHELTLTGAIDGRPEGMILRPLADGDAGELRRIHATPEVARWWDAPGERFPWDEPESTRLTILVDGAIAGLIQFHEEPEPKYRHARIDLFLKAPLDFGEALQRAALLEVSPTVPAAFVGIEDLIRLKKQAGKSACEPLSGVVEDSGSARGV